MKEIDVYYRELMKRNEYRGDSWFIEKSKEFESYWSVFEDKNKLLYLSNNRQDIANFIAYVLDTKFSTSYIKWMQIDTEDWFNRPLAVLWGRSPFQATREGGGPLEALRLLLQRTFQPPYRPRSRMSRKDENNLNEQEMSLLERLNTSISAAGRTLDSNIFFGLNTGSGYCDTRIVYDKYWEIWIEERGGVKLYKWFETEQEIYYHIMAMHRI